MNDNNINNNSCHLYTPVSISDHLSLQHIMCYPNIKIINTKRIFHFHFILF